MDEADTQQKLHNQEAKPSQKDIDRVELVKKMLFDDDYIPEDFLERGATVFPVSHRYRAMNDFYTWFPGFALRNIAERNTELIDKAPEGWRGHTYADLLRDIDQLIDEKGIDKAVISDFSKSVQDKKDTERLEFQRYIYPVFENLVLEKGYPADGIIV